MIRSYHVTLCRSRHTRSSDQTIIPPRIRRWIGRLEFQRALRFQDPLENAIHSIRLAGSNITTRSRVHLAETSLPIWMSLCECHWRIAKPFRSALEVTNCDLQDPNSSLLSTNIKSPGNRSRLRILGNFVLQSREINNAGETPKNSPRFLTCTLLGFRLPLTTSETRLREPSTGTRSA